MNIRRTIVYSVKEHHIFLNMYNEPDKRLFVKQRKEHLEAVKILKKIDKYERQYKLVNVMVEKIFDVIESKRPLLKDFTESDLQDVSFSTVNTARKDFKDGIFDFSLE